MSSDRSSEEERQSPMVPFEVNIPDFFGKGEANWQAFLGELSKRMKINEVKAISKEGWKLINEQCTRTQELERGMEHVQTLLRQERKRYSRLDDDMKVAKETITKLEAEDRRKEDEIRRLGTVIKLAKDLLNVNVGDPAVPSSSKVLLKLQAGSSLPLTPDSLSMSPSLNPRDIHIETNPPLSEPMDHVSSGVTSAVVVNQPDSESELHQGVVAADDPMGNEESMQESEEDMPSSCVEPTPVRRSERSLARQRRVFVKVNSRPPLKRAAPRNPDASNHGDASSEGGWECKCGTKFAERKSLLRHLTSKTIEWEHQCDVCKCYFSMPSQLARHKESEVKCRPPGTGITSPPTKNGVQADTGMQDADQANPNERGQEANSSGQHPRSLLKLHLLNPEPTQRTDFDTTSESPCPEMGQADKPCNPSVWKLVDIRKRRKLVIKLNSLPNLRK